MDRPSTPTPGESPADLEARLLDDALAMPPEARAAWLGEMARRAPAVAERLRALLSELDDGDGFLAPGGALGGVLFDELRDRLSDAVEPSLALVPGDTLGPYRVVEPIGAGGMGEVYRARDTTLGRDVAIKVLPAHLEGRRERVARLQREARVLAALNHPNIASIYGLEQIGDRMALVLELVDGPTLAERLASGPLAPADAIRIARQVVDALEAAHARGVVHRDLKPGNLKITPSGRLKVLDFGIATVLKNAGEETEPSVLSSLTTLSLPSGAVLGTAAYMSPEQVRGEAVDPRADIWAFGCVLFEMLAGTRAFKGVSPAEVMARVLERPAPLDELPRHSPAALRHLVGRCLEKDPGRRPQAIAEARAFLDSAEDGMGESSAATTEDVSANRPSLLSRWPAIAGLALGASVSGLVMWSVMQPAPQPVARLTVPVPATDELITGALPAVAISPDGTTIVYRARRDGELQLFQRALGEAEPRAVSESSNAMAPFFSPDGAWIGFDRDGVLLKVASSGGLPMRLCATGGPSSSASWGDGGEIVVAPTAGQGLVRVAAAGGSPIALTTLDAAKGDVQHTLPEVLPGGRAAVFTIERRESAVIAAVRLDGGQVTELTEGRQARYASNGHLLVVRGDAIWAAPFDIEALALRAMPVPVLRGLDASGVVHFALARNGSLVYVPPRDLDPPRDIVWIDRQGREAPSGIEPHRYLRLTLSPDGTRVALVFADEGNQDLWVQDLSRQTLTRLTFDPHIDTAPIWNPDGRSIAFRSERDGGGMFRVAADGTGRVERLTEAGGPIRTPYAFTPDGRYLLYAEFRSYRDQGIGLLDLDNRVARTLIDEPFAELRPALSPDGRWLAYQADDSGEFEIYVRPFPDIGAGKWQISTAGGKSPQWGPEGRELFYVEGDTMVRVPMAGEGQPVAGPPEPLFSASLFDERLGPLYAVSTDGRRFLVIKNDSQGDRVAARRQLLLVQNWFSELTTLVPPPR